MSVNNTAKQLSEKNELHPQMPTWINFKNKQKKQVRGYIWYDYVYIKVKN